MAQVVPEVRLIVLLRNPVDRAHSHYHYWVRRGLETRSFEEAIETEKARLLHEEGTYHERENGASSSQECSEYLIRGIYVDQLLR